MTRRKLRDSILYILMYLCTIIVCGVLIFLIGYCLYRGIPALSWQFLSSQTSYRDGTIGILPNILNTLYIIITTLIVVVPVGICAAIYLTEYAKSGPLVRIIRFAVQTLTGIPSLIFGLVGMLFFVQLLGWREGILAGSGTLVILCLPTIITNTQESLQSVPNSYREGALALGAGRWHMIRSVVLPNALDGIVTGVILSIGRITGESAALLFTAGIGLELNGYFAATHASSATLSVALYLYAGEEGEFDAAFGIAVILLIITLVLNLIAKAVGRNLRK